MIQHIYNNCIECKRFYQVYIATDSTEIQTYCNENRIPVIMTSSDNPTCMDRVSEAVTLLPQEIQDNLLTVALVQGDEPLFEATHFESCYAGSIMESNVEIVNMVTTISGNDLTDTNVVKSIIDGDGNLTGLTRDPVSNVKQIGAVFFKKPAIVAFKTLPNNNQTELDVQRFLDNGYTVKTLNVETRSIGVDVPEDIARVEAVLNAG
jgi:3-deoxy-manno-octulosonate cytidylyltransferase (CMP-KDO synthetase)